MIGKLILLALFAIAVSASTRVRVINFCDTKILVTAKTDIVRPLGFLQTGFSLYRDYDSNTGLVLIENGYGQDDIYARLNISTLTDEYYLRTNRGFKTGMQLQSDVEDSPVFTCANATIICPDSHDVNPSKTGIVVTGNKIFITWCPFNNQPQTVEALEKAPLVETIQNPQEYVLKNPIHARKYMPKLLQKKL